MAQTPRTTLDIVNTAWTRNSVGNEGTWLSDSICEGVYDDATYIMSGSGPVSTDVYVGKFDSGWTDPVSSIDHYLHFRYYKSASGGMTVNLVAEIRQGYVDESSQGTLICTVTNNNITATTPTAVDYNLSAAEADAITNYNDLYVRFVVTRS